MSVQIPQATGPIAPPPRPPVTRRRDRGAGSRIWDPALLGTALPESFAKLDPRVQIRNPVMFVVELGSLIATLTFAQALAGQGDPLFVGQVAIWLWFTVIFANFAEAMAEARGRAQAETLRRTKRDTPARLITPGGQVTVVSSAHLRRDDVVLIEAHDIVPGDGEVVEGVAFVNEAAITGESAPVLKEPGTDTRSTVTGGTEVISDWIKVRITANPGETFLDRMIALVEGARRQKTPNEIALWILLAGLTIVFLLAVATLQPFAVYSGGALSIVVLIALLVCLIPTTIGGLLSAIGIAGMDRVTRFNVLAMSGRAVEAAGDVDTLLLDKTGTITFGNRMAAQFIPLAGRTETELIEAACLASLGDETPEGRSIVALARRLEPSRLPDRPPGDAEIVPFSAETRLSGLRFGSLLVLKGAVDAIATRATSVPPDLQARADVIAREGGTPLGVSRNGEVLGVVHLKDTVKPGMRERFAELRRLGIRTIMLTGDNPLTAATIAREAGVDDFVAQARPEDKMRVIREQQAEGHLVAMTGDGTNDAPALAQADVGLAMSSGTAAAREAANMVDLDSDPTKLIEVVMIGKQLLITRGAITTFSVANDVAKYFAIIPAAFAATYPALNAINVMQLATPQSSILSAVIFNALIIVLLIPLALRGVAYRAVPAAELLRRNLLVYGLGGILVPFVGVKLIDLLLVSLHLA